MPISRRATSLLACVLALSCRRGSRGADGSGIQIIELDAPLGLEGAAVSHCDSDEKGCRDVGKGDRVARGELVKSAQGARAWLASDAATTVDIAEDSAVLFGTTGNVELRRGGMVVRRLGQAEPKGDPLRVDVASQSGDIDPQLGATVVVRARGADRAGVTVQKGKFTLRAGNGQSLILLSGESAELAKGRPPERVASFVSIEPRRVPVSDPVVIAASEPRGLGRMTARVPGQSDVVSGVRLVSHHVEVVVRDGFARTEVEEVFFNDTARVLEGRYVFPLPADASISRLALWVNDQPVEGEIVEKKRAAAIFKEIVDDTVRPRDPALLEWVAGSDFSLKIFPLPAKGSRKVRIAYDQIVTESGGRIRYAYPLSVGADRATKIDDFNVQVRVSDTRSSVDGIETPGYATRKSGGENNGFQIGFSAKQFAPTNDFVVSYARQSQDEADLSAYVPSWGELKGAGLDGAARGAEGSGYFALRLRADLPLGMTPAHVRRDRAIIVDVSHSQSKETLEGATKIAAGLVRKLDADERFVVLACDSACSSFPASGLATPSDEQVTELDRWLGSRVPSGSSDVSGAILDASRRLDAEGSAQVIYIGDGSPSSGELSADRIATRVRPTLVSRKVDLRFLGAGRAVDEIVIGALAQDLGATYEPVLTGESIERRVADLANALRSPVIRGTTVEVPSNFVDVYPKTLRNLRLGEQVVVLGRLVGQEPGLVKLRGEVAGQTYTLTRPVRWTAEASRQNPLVPRLWALSRIGELESATDAPSIQQVVDMSKRYHVMSRYTSLLVLENDRMFADYGIKRTGPATAGLPADDQPAIGSNKGQAPSAPLGRAKDRDEESRGDWAADKKSESASEGNAGLPAKPKAASPMNPYDDGPARNAPSPVATMAPAMPPMAAPAPPPAKRSEEPSGEESEMSRRSRPATSQPTPSSPSADWSAGGPGFGRSSIGSAGSGAPAAQGAGLSDMPMDSTGSGRIGGIALDWSVQRTAVVQLGSMQVIGDLPRDVVERVVRMRLGAMRACYQNGLNRNPMLSGRMGMTFVIGQDGDVMSSMDGNGGVMALPDAAAASCVLATMRGLKFPTPGASSYVTVSFVVTFESKIDGPMHNPFVVAAAPQPSAVHRAEDDGWLSKGEDALTRLRTDAAGNPTSRRKQEDLVRGLLSRGRFEEALAAAKKFVEMDPDLAVARELLAYAAVTNDDTALALLSVDTQTETEPTSLKWHVRGARAFEAQGDERRACAHWRSLSELAPQSDEYAYESLRCRSRVLSDGDAAIADARRVSKPSKLLSELMPQLESGHAPAFAKSTAQAGQFEATLTCSTGERCPTVFVVSPIGNVFSPFTPTDSRSSAKSVAVAGLRDGTYTTLLAGGSPDTRGEIELRAFGTTKRFTITHGGRQTVAATRVTIPRPSSPIPVAMRNDGFQMIAR